jgi:hypothetical protein
VFGILFSKHCFQNKAAIANLLFASFVAFTKAFN